MELELEAVDRRDEVVLAARRRLDDRRRARERDDADANVAGLVLHERLGRRLRRGEARRLDVGRSHAEGHVHRHDDRALLGRKGHHGRRAGDGHDQRDQREQEQQGRQVPAQPLAAAQRGVDEVEAGVADGALLAAALQQHVQRNERRHGQQQPQHPGPDKRHALVSCVRRGGGRGRQRAGRLRAPQHEHFSTVAAASRRRCRGARAPACRRARAGLPLPGGSGRRGTHRTSCTERS
jgi:hypothetical protein